MSEIFIDDWRDTLMNEIECDGGVDEWARRRAAVHGHPVGGGVGTTPPAPGNAVPRLWTVTEVASFLQVSVSWVRHASAAGHLPCVRFAHNVRFDPDAIRAFSRGEGIGRGRTVVPGVNTLLEKRRGGAR